MTITIRIHPTEALNKFDYLRQSYRDIKIIIEKPEDGPLSESIKRIGVVIDIKKILTLIARLLNKLVASHILINR